MKTFYLLLLSAALLPACTQRQPAATQTEQDTTDRTITAVPDPGGKPPAVPDTQFIMVDSMVNIRVNDVDVPRRPGAFDSILSATWRDYYAGSQELPKFIRFKYQGTVMMGARGSLMDEVVKAQDSLKAHIAQEKYKKPFADLTPQERSDMQKAFPVLFQKTF